MRDTTYGRDANRARTEGRAAYASARGDAMEHMNCEVCGYKRNGRDTCRECGAGPEKRKTAKNDGTGKFPMGLREARKWTGKK